MFEQAIVEEFWLINFQTPEFFPTQLTKWNSQQISKHDVSFMNDWAYSSLTSLEILAAVIQNGIIMSSVFVVYALLESSSAWTMYSAKSLRSI